MTPATRSYTAAASVGCSDARALERYARLFCRAVRHSFAQVNRRIRAGLAPQSRAERKQEVVQQFGLTSRQANAVLVEADGKRDAQRALDKLNLEALSEKLRKKTRQLKEAQSRLGRHREGKTLRLDADVSHKLAQRIYLLQTSLSRLTARRTRLKAQVDSGITNLTFGTKGLLRQRHGLATRRERSQWRKAWDAARHSQFLVLGSKDETGGCQGCVATVAEDGSVCLRVRLPDPLGGGYVQVTGVRFQYGAQHLRHALAQQAVRAESKAREQGKLKAQVAAQGEAPRLSQKAIEGGAAITWRFMRQADGSWRVCFTTEVTSVPLCTSVQVGAVGVDFNAGFVTATEADRFGNLLHSRNLMAPTVGRRQGQRDAAMGEAVKSIVAQCVATGKPLVLEELDFARKKKSENLSPSSRRTVSAMAYAQFLRLCQARAQDAGVQLVLVNPAYTSTQGLVRYAQRRGWSAHQAAAGVIARRGMGFEEKAPVSGTLRVPVAGAAVEWPIPEDIRQSDVRQRWPRLHQGLREAIALHFRNRRAAGWRGSASPPLCPSKVTGGIPVLKRPVRAPAPA